MWAFHIVCARGARRGHRSATHAVATRRLLLETLEVRRMLAAALVGLYDSATATFHLSNANAADVNEQSVNFGPLASDAIPLVGDWTGSGSAGVGVYDPRSSTFHLVENAAAGLTQYTFGFGVAGAGWVPLVGDWDGSGKSGVGLYDPQTSTFYLTSALTTGFAQYTFGFGQAGLPETDRWQPLVGDWNGSGHAGVGLYAPVRSTFMLTSSLASGYAQYTFDYGAANLPVADRWQPLVGDWNGSGHAGVGLYDPASSTFLLTSALVTGYAQDTIGYGAANLPAAQRWQPIVGDWNDSGHAGVGLYDTQDATFCLTSHLATGYAQTTFRYGTPGAAWQPVVGGWPAPGPTVGSLTATAYSATQINLQWQSVAGASAYVIDQWTPAAQADSPGVWKPIATVEDGSSHYSVQGLTADTNYQFRVAAAQENWAAGWSNTATATTGVAVDHPQAFGDYFNVNGTLFGAHGPSYLDVQQGMASDCWLLAALAEVAARDPQLIRNMFQPAGSTVENGTTVDLYQVGFYDAQGKRHWVTVDTELPALGDVYDRPLNGVLWAALAEKAYVEANAAGYVTTYAEGVDAYGALDNSVHPGSSNSGGYASWGLQAITGLPASQYAVNPTNVAAACNAGQLVVLGTGTGASAPASSSIATWHYYAVVGCNPSAGGIPSQPAAASPLPTASLVNYVPPASQPFALFNPWGSAASGYIPEGTAYYGLFTANAGFLAANFNSQVLGSPGDAPPPTAWLDPLAVDEILSRWGGCPE